MDIACSIIDSLFVTAGGGGTSPIVIEDGSGVEDGSGTEDRVKRR